MKPPIAAGMRVMTKGTNSNNGNCFLPRAQAYSIQAPGVVEGENNADDEMKGLFSRCNAKTEVGIALTASAQLALLNSSGRLVGLAELLVGPRRPETGTHLAHHQSSWGQMATHVRILLIHVENSAVGVHEIMWPW